MNPSTALFADPASKEHITGPGHPERPARFEAALRGVSDWPLSPKPSRAASEEDILACHTRAYLRVVERDVAAGRHELATGDTAICPRSLDAALRAAGALLNGVDAVLGREAVNAFCIVRPPGHHATPDRGMGFCLFNNIAIAARYAQRKYGVDRVLIADWDVHHGNGTQDIFYSDGSVFFFSTHQHPWYPGTGAPEETGEGAGEGTTLNCPFPAGAGRDEILEAFEQSPPSGGGEVSTRIGSGLGGLRLARRRPARWISPYGPRFRRPHPPFNGNRRPARRRPPGFRARRRL